MTSDASCRSVAPAPRISCPGPDAHVARLAPCIGGSPHRQGRLKTRRFRAWLEDGPKRLPSNWPAISRSRWTPCACFFRTRTEVSGTLSPAADRPSPSDGHERLSRATPRSRGPFRPSRAFARGGRWSPGTDRERCSSSTSATDSQGTCTMSNRSKPGVTRPLARSRHARRRKSPANSPSHEVFDDTPRALVVELHARHASACEDRARGDPAGPRSRDPRPAPPSMRRCLPRAGRAPLPLTPCRRRVSTEVLIHRWTRPTPQARQGPRIERARAPSIDECPLDPALARGISNADPPPCAGFCHPGPASDALSLPRAPLLKG